MDGKRGRIAASISAAAVIVLLLQSFASANHCTGCIDKQDIERDAVGAAEIVDGSVGKPEVGAAAVGTSEIKNQSVRLADIAPPARTKAFYAFHSAEQEVGGVLVDLALPKGSYWVHATALITAQGNNTLNPSVTCTLTAGTSTDSMTFALPDDNTSEDPRQITLVVPVVLASAGTADLSCDDSGDDDAGAAASRLTALRVGGVSSENDA